MMRKHLLFPGLMALLLALTCLSACTTTAPVPDAGVVTAPALTATALLARAAPYISADAVAVAVIDARDFQQLANPIQWSSSDPEVTRALHAEQRRLYEASQKVLLERLMIDPLSVDHVVVAVRKDAVDLVFFGVKIDPKAPRKTQGARQLVRVFPNSEPDRELAEGVEIWVQAFAQGIVFSFPTKAAPDKASLGAPSHPKAMSDSPRLASFTTLLANAKSTFTVGVLFDDPKLQEKMLEDFSKELGVPAPRALRFTLDEDYSIAVQADPEALKVYKKRVEEGIAEAKGEVDAMLDKRPVEELSMPEAIAKIQGDYLHDIFTMGLRIEIEGELLRASFPSVSLDTGIFLYGFAGVFGALTFVGQTLGNAKEKEAKVEIANLSNAIEMYRVSNRTVPTNLAELAQGSAPILQSIPLDPWGRPFVYRYKSAREHELLSMGADGIEGTADDIQ